MSASNSKTQSTGLPKQQEQQQSKQQQLPKEDRQPKQRKSQQDQKQKQQQLIVTTKNSDQVHQNDHENITADAIAKPTLTITVSKSVFFLKNSLIVRLELMLSR